MTIAPGARSSSRLGNTPPGVAAEVLAVQINHAVISAQIKKVADADIPGCAAAQPRGAVSIIAVTIEQISEAAMSGYTLSKLIRSMRTASGLSKKLMAILSNFHSKAG